MKRCSEMAKVSAQPAAKRCLVMRGVGRGSMQLCRFAQEPTCTLYPRLVGEKKLYMLANNDVTFYLDQEMTAVSLGEQPSFPRKAGAFLWLGAQAAGALSLEPLCLSLNPGIEPSRCLP